MGGRGASSGMSNSGKKYGSEYTTVYQSGNIKFIKQNANSSITAPMETMTNGRIYVTLNQNNIPKSITYYDKKNHRKKQVDIKGRPHNVKGTLTLPHTHKGYFHAEYGTTELSPKEQKMVERVLKTWDNRIR